MLKSNQVKRRDLFLFPSPRRIRTRRIRRRTTTRRRTITRRMFLHLLPH
jgi:hypothetical protein